MCVCVYLSRFRFLRLCSCRNNDRLSLSAFQQFFSQFLILPYYVARVQCIRWKYRLSVCMTDVRQTNKKGWLCDNTWLCYVEIIFSVQYIQLLFSKKDFPCIWTLRYVHNFRNLLPHWSWPFLLRPLTVLFHCYVRYAIVHRRSVPRISCLIVFPLKPVASLSCITHALLNTLGQGRVDANNGETVKPCAPWNRVP